MSVNKEVYKLLFEESCRGMCLTERGTSTRYEMTLREPGSERWNEIKTLTHTSNEEMDSFFRGAKGEYFVSEQHMDYPILVREILAGEYLKLVFQNATNGDPRNVKLIKLSPVCFLVTHSTIQSLPCGESINIPENFTFQKGPLNIPTVGNINLVNLFFLPPSSYHQKLDVSLLHNFHKTKVAPDIRTVYNQAACMIQHDSSKDEIQQLLDLLAETGTSTFAARIFFDTLTTK